MSDKKKLLDQITAKINKAALKANPDGGPIAFVAGDNRDLLDLGVLPTGNPAIDDALGGGMPKGSIIQVVGEPGVGKTRMALGMVASNQRRAKAQGEEFYVLYVNLETRSFPYIPAIEAGVDLDSMIVINAHSSGEKTLDSMMKYLWDWEKRQPLNLLDMVVIDSVAAAAPESELDKAQEDGFAAMTVGRQAAMMSKVMRVLAGSGALGNTLLFLVNQFRADIAYAGGKTIPGGKAMGYYPKVIIEVRAPKGERLTRGPKTKPEVYGHKILGNISKNNSGMAPPHRTFEYDVIYGEGVDIIGPILDIAVRKGVIDQTSSAWYQVQFAGELKRFNGRAALEAFVKSTPEFLTFLQEAISQVDTDKAVAEAPDQSVTISDIPDSELPDEEFEVPDELDTFAATDDLAGSPDLLGAASF